MDIDLLLGFLVFFFVFSSLVLFFSDILFFGLYVFLFIYGFFALLGYWYFPDFSEGISAYFGQDEYIEYFTFYSASLFFCFVSFFLLSLITSRTGVVLYRVTDIKGGGVTYKIYVFLYFLFLIGLSLLFIKSYGQVDYSSAPSGNFALLIAMFKYLTVFCFVHYASIFAGDKVDFLKHHKMVLFLAIFSFILEMAISFKIGSRTDLLALILGIVFLHLYKSLKLGGFGKIFFRVVIVIIPIMLLLFSMEYIREENARYNGLAKAVIVKDYFAPLHILFATMHYQLVDPLNVIKSNFYNTFVMMGYPYLQTGVGNMLIEGSSSRSTGFAMHIFSEGYMFSGWLGLVYNCAVVTVGIFLWRSLSLSSSFRFNCFAIGLVAMQFANISRGQSMYFLKDIYMIFIPAIILYFAISGQRLGRLKL